MLTVNDFCRRQYGTKLYKIGFDAGFTCPNRDGKLGDRGCIFCTGQGSGDFAVRVDKSGTEEEIELAKQKVAHKYKGSKYIAYFQAFTNTYKDAETLKQIYMPIVKRDDIAVLSIATRPDCLDEEIYALLDELNHIKPLWVELGLQTTKRSSVSYIRRGYETKVYDAAVKRLNKLGIHTITHIILFLPGESRSDMLRSVKHAAAAGTKGIKLQVLQVLKGTDLAKDYEEHPFDIPTLPEYVQMLRDCVDICPADMVFHRLSGDPPKRLLIEPKWSADKKSVLNAIKDEFDPPKPYYVYMIECEDGSYYTGSTNDVEARFYKHLSGKGAKYTRSRKAVSLIYVEACRGKSAALKREYAIKQLDKDRKRELVGSDSNCVKKSAQNLK